MVVVMLVLLILDLLLLCTPVRYFKSIYNSIKSVQNCWSNQLNLNIFLSFWYWYFLDRMKVTWIMNAEWMYCTTKEMLGNLCNFFRNHLWILDYRKYGHRKDWYFIIYWNLYTYFTDKSEKFIRQTWSKCAAFEYMIDHFFSKYVAF